MTMVGRIFDFAANSNTSPQKGILDGCYLLGDTQKGNIKK